jgi:signal peptidase II
LAYTIVIILLVLLDQAVKLAVRTQIPLGGQVDFLPHVLGLTHIHNSGAAFSMLSGARWFFVALTLVFVVVALWFLLKGKRFHPFGSWMLALVIAGALGNLIDRAVYGYVVDMFEVLFMHFAIFNVADIFVVVGGLGFCLYYGFFHEKWTKKETDTHADPM